MALIGTAQFNAGGFGAPTYYQTYDPVTMQYTITTTAPNAMSLSNLPVEPRAMPVIGYRAWNWTDKFVLGVGRRGHLHGTGMPAPWKGDRLTATCLAGMAHFAPEPNCGCGIYVMGDMDELDSHVALNDQVIVGAAMGWGRVVQHGREGWRAQHCRVLALLDCKLSEAQLKLTRTVAKELGVPVLERAGIERYVREWGDPFADPVKALPEANVG